MKKFGLALLTALYVVFDASARGERVVEEKNVDSPAYLVGRTALKPALDGNWEGPVWKDVPALDISHFYETHVSDHRPKTQAKVLFDESGLYIHFRVEDRYVRSIETEYHGKVWEDACVEFFVQPLPDRGYFNFEINCGGTMLLSYKESPTWKGASLREEGQVPWALAKTVEIFHTLPEKVEPEITEPVVWHVEYHIPFAVFDAYLGERGAPAGQTWCANFYKCAENNTHPHWASWSRVEGELNFHKPEYFAPITFAK